MSPKILLGCVAGAALAMPAQAAITTLFDGNSAATIDDTGAFAGMTGWNVGGVNQLALQGFWYRITGMNREDNIGTLPIAGILVTDTNGFVDPRPDTLSIRYQGAGFYIEVSWRLQGGTASSFSSDIAEQIRIVNNGNGPLAMSFFQYSDFDLGGTALDQSVSISGGQIARQSDVGFVMSETVVTPAPTRFEAGNFPGILNRLNDNAVDNLNNVTGPIGPGDLAWAFQWDMVINPGGSILISKDKQIVPTPGTIALLGLAGMIASRRRR